MKTMVLLWLFGAAVCAPTLGHAQPPVGPIKCVGGCTSPSRPTQTYGPTTPTQLDPRQNFFISSVESDGEFSIQTEDGRTLGSSDAAGVALDRGARITTGPSGHARIRLPDGTVFSVGPNASISLSDFAYDASAGAWRLSIAMVSGEFRWVSGSGSPRINPQVKTTAGLATISGGDFGSTVEPGGSGELKVDFGQLQFTDYDSGNIIANVAAGGRLAFDENGRVTAVRTGAESSTTTEERKPITPNPSPTLDDLNSANTHGGRAKRTMNVPEGGRVFDTPGERVPVTGDAVNATNKWEANVPPAVRKQPAYQKMEATRAKLEDRYRALDGRLTAIREQQRTDATNRALQEEAQRIKNEMPAVKSQIGAINVKMEDYSVHFPGGSGAAKKTTPPPPPPPQS